MLTSSNIVKIAISTLDQLRSLSQSLFVRLLKVTWISTILKVLVDLAEGESHFILAVPKIDLFVIAASVDIGSAASLQSSHLKPTDERTGAAHPVHMQ